MKFLGEIALALSLALGTAAPAVAEEYRLLSSWDQNYQFNPHLLTPFIEGVKKATEGRVSITFSGPEAVPAFEQLEPVGNGVFHFLFTHGSYHIGTTPILSITESIATTSAALRENGVFDYLDKHYQQFGLKLVMLPITPEGAYHMILRNPVKADGSLKGYKVRGAVPYKPMVEMLGGVLTVLPPSEIYTALDSGLVDGAAWPSIGVLDYKWYEVAKYLLRPTFGVNYEPLFMNLDAWNDLSEADQQAMTKVSREIEDAWYTVAPTLFAKEQDELIKRGMQVTEMGAEQQAKIKTSWAAGLWAMGMERNAKVTQEYRDLMKSKGLAE
jgi:TRAP-type C4-dicarboxylate transport system substrate-binding protein